MRFLLVVLFPFALLSSPSFAADEAPSAVAAPQAPASDLATAPTLSPAEQLATINHDIAWLENEIANRRKAQARANREDAAEMEDDIANLELRLQRARLAFIATASEVELPAPEDLRKPQKRDLGQEAQDLIEPIFDAVRRVSEKPRRIEAMRTRIFYLRDHVAQIDKAITGLDRVLKAKTYPGFTHQLQDSKAGLKHDRDELVVRIESIQRKLDSELDDHRTVTQVVIQGLQDFVSTKGKNLAIAFFVFASILWLMLSLKRALFRTPLVQRKLHRYRQPIQTLYGALAGITAVSASILTLHLLNDWFLATLILLGLFAFFWLLKSVIHLFVHEIRLMLNLGTVKQGERVVWQGVPWFVKTLGFRSVLVNDELQGGTLALPASILGTLFSRTVVEGEPWFPTRPGDFVQLDDGSYGRIETQTPEMVVLLSGGARKHYSTTAFLSKNPQNFSKGFELEVEVPVTLSGIAPDEVRDSLVESLQTKLAREVELKELSVSLCLQGEGAASIIASASCAGSAAAKRDALRRVLQTAVTEVWQELAREAATAG